MIRVNFDKGNGLVPVIVQDVQTGAVLMLAYMNEESLRMTMDTGRATYYSRSRQELWIKGETSGHYQYVKDIRIDCDEDTILLLVEQVGAACHTGHTSCFLPEYGGRRDMKELDALYETIKDRKENKEEGSYTTYLFEKGLEKILKKVGEECTEVVIASLTQTKEDQINEIGDLLYHLTVLMVEKGISMDDVNAELKRRAQKTHNLKAERKPIEHL